MLIEVADYTEKDSSFSGSNYALGVLPLIKWGESTTFIKVNIWSLFGELEDTIEGIVMHVHEQNNNCGVST